MTKCPLLAVCILLAGYAQAGSQEINLSCVYTHGRSSLGKHFELAGGFDAQIQLEEDGAVVILGNNNNPRAVDEPTPSLPDYTQTYIGESSGKEYAVVQHLNGLRTAFNLNRFNGTFAKQVFAEKSGKLVTSVYGECSKT